LGTPVGSEVRGPGRPRDPNLESRVFAAVLKIYAEAGWSGFSFDAVARSAGVGKAPLYLRWKTKEDLLLSALSAHYRSISITDSGNLRDDLVEYAARLLESKATPDGWAFLRIHLEATVVPALQARFSSQIAIPHVEGARALLHRAVDSGELPADTAVDLLLDSLYGAIVIRMSLSPPAQRAQLAAEPYRYAVPIVDFVLSGLPARERPVGQVQVRAVATSPGPRGRR
jgi:AcrR family transcriptional regulator